MLKYAAKKTSRRFEIIHMTKNLFCYVIRICNLVQEFNGLVSKGPVVILALLLFKNQYFVITALL